MENYTLQKDISLLYLTVTTFPEGIDEAFDRLKEKIGAKADRQLFGISRPENGKIIYKAAVSAHADETIAGLEKFILPKGTYISQLIKSYASDPKQIAALFQQLLRTPGLDPNGYCVEMYEGADVRCMVRLA